MPPQQCPECGRFLKRALVEGLTATPAPCPKCGTTLTAAMFGGADDVAVAAPAVSGGPGEGSPDEGPPAIPPGITDPDVIAPEAAAPAITDPTPIDAAPSIRPPDLAPELVRDRDDPLAGWDVGVALPEVVDRRPFPTDTVLLVAGAVGGAVVGTLTSERRGRAGVLGALAGVGAVAVIRRVWQLPDA